VEIRGAETFYKNKNAEIRGADSLEDDVDERVLDVHVRQDDNGADVVVACRRHSLGKPGLLDS